MGVCMKKKFLLIPFLFVFCFVSCNFLPVECGIISEEETAYGYEYNWSSGDEDSTIYYTLLRTSSKLYGASTFYIKGPIINGKHSYIKEFEDPEIKIERQGTAIKNITVNKTQYFCKYLYKN